MFCSLCRFTEHGGLFAPVPHRDAHPWRLDLQLDPHRRFPVNYGVSHQLADEEQGRLDDVLRIAGQGLPDEPTGSCWDPRGLLEAGSLRARTCLLSASSA